MFVNPGVILAFHGCDKEVRDKIVQSEKEQLWHSKKNWEWLGDGIYFWENSYEKALDWAKHLKDNPMPSGTPVQEPAVIGAIIDLKNCLDFLDAKHLRLLKQSYQILKDSPNLPQNTDIKDSKNADLIIRKLDYYVIENIHIFNKSAKVAPFDTVRSVFWEGDLPYETAGFKDKNHIQICVRNPDCIKGYFIPRHDNDRIFK